MTRSGGVAVAAAGEETLRAWPCARVSLPATTRRIPIVFAAADRSVFGRLDGLPLETMRAART